MDESKTSDNDKPDNGVVNTEDPKPIIEDKDVPEAINTSKPVESDPFPEGVPADITSDQISQLKLEAIDYAKDYAKSGISSRKEPSPDLANDQGPYTWWEKQDTYEANTWSISYWEYDSGSWQIQATKVELLPDGHSRMTAYSLRKDTDTSFPGFQVYKEQSDDRYHPAAIEEIVYLNRVLKGLKESIR